MDPLKKLLDSKTLNKLKGLELKARMIVEGYVSGLHKSPYHGFSVEFAEHREYVPGDDLRGRLMLANCPPLVLSQTQTGGGTYSASAMGKLLSRIIVSCYA